MNQTRRLIPWVMALLWVAGCSSSSSSEEPAGGGGAAGAAGSAGAAGQDAGTDQGAEAALEASLEAEPEAAPEAGPDAPPDAIDEPVPAEKICAEVEPGFDEANPGMSFTFDTGTSVLMGQEIALAVGVFMKTAREDYCKQAKGLQVPLDTCTDQAAPGVLPQCTTHDECGPEQECKPQTNNNNQPIPGTERCVTARQPLNVGPFTVTGFAGGPLTFQYNPQQQGAYTIPNSDGTLPAGTFASDTDYTFSGTLDGDAGLGVLSGTYHVPAAFTWISPALVDIPNMPGVKAIEVTPGQDLVLQWSGGEPQGTLSLTMNGAPNGGGKTITCRASNDGSFTIPATLVDAAKLGNFAFFNALDMRMESKPSQVVGAGLTRSKVTVVQTRMLNLVLKQ